MKQKILITGACGLIGSNFVFKLLDYNFDLILIDNLSTGFKENLLKIKKKANLKKKNIFFYNIDLKNRKKLSQIFLINKIEFIFHFAALTSVEQSIKNPKKFIFNNVCSTQNLLHFIKIYNIKNFIFSSSAAVYGNVKFKDNIKEDIKLKPINAYGRSKKICEDKIIEYSKKNSFRFCIFRYFNVVGKDLAKNLRPNTNLNLFEKLELYKRKKKVIKIFGKKLNTHDGTPVRDFISVDDVVDAHMVCIKITKISNFWNKIYNIGHNNGLSVLDIILEHNKFFKQKIRYKFVNSKKKQISRSVANNKKFLRHSNWRPKINNLKKIVNFFFKSI